MRCSADGTVLHRIAQKCGQTQDEHFDLNQRWGLKLGLALFLTLGVGLLTAAPASAADCPDNDGDGFVVCDGDCDVPVGKQCGDCNDDNADINPGATERCDDAIDSDCDGDNNNGYPNLGQDCALCNGPDCGGVTFCISSGPGENCGSFTGDLCLTGSLAAAPDLNGVVCGPDGLSETCAPPDEAPIAIWAQEGLGQGNPGNISESTCSDGQDNNCDGYADLEDNACWAPEICDGLDNDGDGLIDEDFPLSDPGQVGNICDVGIGECSRSSTWACNEAGTDAVCGATPGAPKNEGTLFGNSCADGKDNNCDGLTDLADPLCAGFGDPELCGDGIDNDGDGVIDEGFPQIGQACQAGVGACRVTGQLVCNSEAPVPGIGDGVACNAVALDAPEPGIELSCDDFIDNDCDGLTDGDDPDCGAALADLGVTCSLPWDVAKPGDDCTGRHRITFGAATDGVTLKADLLALNTDGTLLGIIEGVNDGDTAHLASRLDPTDWNLVTKTNKKGSTHTVFYPMPLLKVTGTKGGLEDVAYCSILPYHEVTDPDGLTFSLSETNTLKVSGFLPLVDVDSLSISLDGIDILAEGGINPVTAFPTNGSPLCTAPGECVLQVAAGCGDGGMVEVEISNLIVEGLDTDLAFDAKAGVQKPGQVNTYSFDVSGLPPGGHIFYIAGMPLPLPPLLDEQCLQDDLADTGTASAFGIQILSPSDQQIVASAPVLVEGTACGGNEIVDLKIQGNDLDVTVGTSQTCTTGNGLTVADECYVDFAEPIGETDLDHAAKGTAAGGTFHAGSNRVIADATDDEGNRTFNTDVIFGLGETQPPGLALTAEEESFRVAGQKVGNAVANEIIYLQEALAAEINPAFVVGLEESAVQDFFNEKCEGALDQFAAQAAANLNNKTFATISLTPSCSCDLNNVPIVLESVTFTPSTADPTCAVDFRTGEIGVTIHLPDIRVQVGAHRSCTTRGLFDECVARTKLNITAVSQILNPAFEFVITEDQIETKTAPSEDTQIFTWIIADGDGTPLFNPGLCDGGTQDGESCITDGQCPGAAKPEGLACVGETKNDEDDGYNPVTQNDSGIECYGAAICNVFAGIGGVLIEIFTLGFADGFEIVGIIDFDFEFKEDFLAELDGAEPDPLELDEIEIDEEAVASFDQGKFTAGAIDVEIQPGGLKIEFPATFESQTLDPGSAVTPGAVVTPAVGPTITNLIAAGDEISIGMADDVFNQLFASMKDAGTLKAFCTDGDGLTVDSLLPPICDSLGAADGEVTVGDATIQGICHAIRGASCNTLTAGTAGLTNAKVGACTGFSGGDCTTLNLGQKIVCNAVPARDISSDDSVLFCARQDMEPRLLFRNSAASDNRVDTDLLLNDLNVVLAIDKANDGYTGELEALQGCFGEEGNSAPDCLLYATCLDLTLKTEMGIDNSSCAPNQTGFVFGLKEVIHSGVQAGVMCSAATTAADNEVIEETAKSTTIDTVAQSAEAFTPPFCAEGLTLGGILDFTSPDAKIFTITTDEATMGFADFLFLTGSLGPPNP